MRIGLSVLAAILALGGCGPSKPVDPAGVANTASARDGCALTAREPVAFTGPDAQDVVEARAFGPDCRNVFVMLTLRAADGRPLWIWATAQPWLPPQTEESVDPAASGVIEQFLADWAKVKVDTTQSLPDWPQRETAFTDKLGPFLSTPFTRDRYLEIRAKAAARLCYATGIGRGECIYYDAESGSAQKVLDSGD
jgi:hypothetical protein